MSVYAGDRHSDGVGHQLVTKENDILSPVPSQRLANHSPDGFNWGYGGSGPAQLALAILFDVTGDKDIALRYYQDFKREVVARWGDIWRITTTEVLDWLEDQMQHPDADD